ncbi:MAG TPA: AMP-binding protein, partial [Gemmatimonadaceae bacterium]|nr:AMP-binding protein [Gemmatimonadaceae bacterium]
MSIRCAEVLLARGHEIHGVISDNAEVVRWGRTRAVPVLDPSNDLGAALTETPYDFLFSIVNERILPPAVTASPERLAINYHDAPLPRYAGMHATSWALMNHETAHAISWHVASEVVDAGDVLVRRSVPIEPEDTALSLNAKCYEAAAEAFVELTEALERGDPPRQPQDLSRRTYFGRYDRPAAAAILDWRRPVADLSALARALDFGPYANPLGRPKLLLDGRVLACREVTRAPNGSRLEPGTIVDVGPDALTIAAADGDALVRHISSLDGRELARGALSGELGLRSGMTLPLLSDELAARVSAVNTRAARSESRWIPRLATARATASPFSREAPVAGVERWHRLDIGLPPAFAEIPSENAAAQDVAARLVAAVAIYVSRLCRERDLDFGLRLPDIEKSALSHLFATVVPVRLRVESANSFGVLVEQVAAALDQTRRLGTYARDLPSRYPTLRDRGASRYRVQIQLEGDPDPSRAEPMDVPDLQIALGGDGACISLFCREGAVSADDAARMATHLEALVAGIAAAPERTVGRLPIVPAAERRRLTVEWNATTAPYPRDLTIHELIEAEAKRSPNAVAVTDGRTSMTYCELDNRAEAVALRLRASGVEPGTRVGVFAGKSAALVVAILGVLKSGGAYVPLDVEYPADRLRFMIEDASLTTFVVEASAGPCPAPDGSAVIGLDASGALTSETRVGMTEAGPRAGPDDIAYVIYTSGSTGRPKGVLIPHRGVVNYLTWAAAAYQADAGAGAPLHSSPAFDLTVTALFAPLISGTAVQLVDQSLGPDALAAALRQRPGCSLVKITPAHLTLLSQQLTPDEARAA